MLAQLTMTSEYHDWHWDLVARLRAAVEKTYAQNAGEIPCIEAMVREVTRTSPAMSADAPADRVEVEGAFLHGSRSQVKFSVGGVQHQRELADLLVLSSYVEGRTLKWQRACLIQAKRGSAPKATSPSRFSVDEWQLALLRAFPEFEGVSGVFAGLKCHLRNRTGMLGAYGFLAAPGEFTVISARVLNQLLGGRKSLTGKELTPTILSERAALSVSDEGSLGLWWPFDPELCPECRHLFEEYLPFPWHRYGRHHAHPHPGRVHPFVESRECMPESTLSCLGLDEFVDSWVALRLGEPWRVGADTRSDRGLHRALYDLVSRIARGSSHLSQLLRLLGEAGHDNLPPGRDERTSPEPGPGGLAILSAVATTGRQE